ncbi:cytochrome P450 [Streptomyces scopuliridis]|uniref:Cytochrome P450 n=1 Tax=Streptomyces scopuliridis TaxID=452529 RepID=A0ACD4ZX02_9ACTN|nr:cytochrome P450 [Streptomyces scopuliridis]WSB37900.1 cytochrome P450 [Streptomyces scopuliridis]WSC02352.1 cytochrome P450 [Streptomyces scopuliridis]WSC04111.1 cytochrome P450 [Streptomyces scopuliridis]
MPITVAEAGRTLADPATYADDELLHAALSLLRREAPVHWVEAPGYNPFWAVTRHADIQEVERENETFLSAPRPVLVGASVDAAHKRSEAGRTALRPLIHLDGHEHRGMRGVIADRFRPQAVGHLEPRVRALAGKAVDRMREFGSACEFVGDVSDVYALDVLLCLMGLDRSESAQIFRFTPAGRRPLPPEARQSAMREFYTYFMDLAARRRARPTDDLASVIANARLDGRLLDDREMLSSYIIILSAGHDTAGATIAGGLKALIENPGQLDMLREHPDRLPSAVDEMIRWVTPVKGFMRTAVQDYTLRDVVIRKGDSVLLSYPSANRDEAVFDAPHRFDVERTPNRHLAFGYGVHHCLGAALAKLEILSFFAELLPRIGTMELSGEPAYLSSAFSGGLKYLPLRYSWAH